MRCSKCGIENPSGKKFCGDCGAPLANLCPKCGADNPAGKRFCGECGGSLGISSADSGTRRPEAAPVRVIETVDPEKLVGERKTVTALFADIKGSTELEQDLDPEEARAIVDPALKLMIDAVRRYDGYIVQSTGDGIFGLFGAPVAHEDHPQRALYASLRMQEELRRYGSKLQAGGRAPIEIRVGVNTGEVVVRSISTGGGHVEYTPIGHTSNLASRLQTIARTGSIVASEATRKFCEGYFALKPLGPTRVKGVIEPVNAYEVTGLGPLRTRLQRSAGRGLTKFVGREREMDAMRYASELVRAGRGQLVAAMAEAGTGKSRLFFEFKAKNRSGWMVLEAFSVSHHKASSYLPVIDLLHSYFNIASQDDQRTRREKIAGRIAILDRTLEDAIPYLYSLLEIVAGDDPLGRMDAQVKNRRTLDAIKRILIRESLNQPLMVIFEDLHWIDEETQALLNLLADSIGTAKILLLVNYRPEYRHQWGNKTYYTQLRLDPLEAESGIEMLSALLGDGLDLKPLKRLIIERTEGNPFFMEETVQVLFDDGALVRNGTVKLTKYLSELRIPPTVQSILASRIDRLRPHEKDLLQTLAVIGREFSLSVLKAVVSKPADDLNRMLSDLQLGEFIYEQPAIGDIEFTFKHALTQEVAYNSVLIERRKELHELAAHALEALFPDRLDDHTSELARHYSRSNDARKAIHYLKRAGQRAQHRSAFSEARSYLADGFGLLKKLSDDRERDRQELALQIALSHCLSGTKGLGSVEFENALRRARELCEQVGDDISLFRVLEGLRILHLFRQEPKTAQELAQEQVAIAERLQAPRVLAAAHAARGITSVWLGELPASREDLAMAASLYAQEAPTDHLRIPTLSYLSFPLLFLGYPDQASKRSRESLSVAGAHSPFVAVALSNAWDIHRLLGDRSAAMELAERELSLAKESGSPSALSYGVFHHGWSLAEEGQVEAGLTEMRGALAAIEATGVVGNTWMVATMAESYLKIGQAQEGLRMLAPALALAERAGDRLFEAELHRLKGEMLLIGDEGAAAKGTQCFRNAIEVAQRQSAKTWELRATTSLARLLAKQGKRDEARAMLAEIYNWFTEGFDTADLKDAKALLDELRA